MPRGTVTPEVAALRDRLLIQLFDMSAKLYLSEAELAKRSGVSTECIRQWRVGTSKPRAVSKLQKLVTELAIEATERTTSAAPAPATSGLVVPVGEPLPKTPRTWTTPTKERKRRQVQNLRRELDRLNITPIEALRVMGKSTKNSAIYAWLNGSSLPRDNSILPIIRKLTSIPNPPGGIPSPLLKPPTPQPSKPNGPIHPSSQQRPQVVVGLIKAISKLKLDDQVALLQMLES